MKQTERKDTVLVIDDQPATLAMLFEYLKQRDVTVVVSENGESGLKRADYVRPDLILLDVTMPGPDGFEVCRRLRENKDTGAIPVIFMTAHTGVEEKVKGFEAGGVDFVNKPLQLDEVWARIRNHLTISRLQRRLLQSEEKYRHLVEGAPAVVYSFSDKRGTIYCSSRVTSLLGYTVSYLYENPFLWNQSVHQDDIPRIKHCIEKFAEGKNFDIEYRIKDAHGQWHWLRDLSFSRRTDGDEVIIDGMAYDITERKHAEEQLRNYAEKQKVLLREVNHRVKNNLTAIIGMLYKEQGRAERKGITGYTDVLEDLICRVEGLFTVHSLLSESGWQPLLITDLCEQVVHSVSQGTPLSKKISLDISPSPLRLTSNQAHHLTLVINELATNTIKHALTGSDIARIRIDISQEEKMIQIVYRDDGPGFPEEMIAGDFSRANVGFDLMFGIVRESLKGDMVLANDNGAVTTIRFRAEMADGTKEV